MSKVDDARKSELQAFGRKAYGEAMAALRENHRSEFEDLLDSQFREAGLESPRMKRIARAKAADVARKEAEQRAAERALKRLAKARESLAAAEAAAASLTVDEEFAGLAGAIESVTTADE